MQYKRFLSHLILTLSWWLKYKIGSDKKKLHPHTIPCFESLKSPFELQPGSGETQHASHPYTEVQRCPWRNQRRVARAVCDWYEPSTPRRNSRTAIPARSSRRLAKLFLLDHYRNQAYLPSTLCKPSRWEQTHSGWAARWARTRSLEPNSIESISPPATSRATFPDDPKQSPPLTHNIVSFEAMRGHWTKEGFV